MLHIKKRLFQNKDINPWITDSTVYLGSSKVWRYDLFFGYADEELTETTGDYNVLNYDGQIEVGVIVNVYPHIFQLEKFDWMEHGRAGLQIIERAISLGLIDRDKYQALIDAELKRNNVKVLRY